MALTDAATETIDRTRFAALFAPLHDRARRSARRLCRSPADGDDLFHEAVVRALDKLDGLRDEASFNAWFYAILLSVHRNRARRAFWGRFLPLDVWRSGEPVGQDGARWEEERQGAARASQALASLPAEQREAIVLFDLDGFSIEEVAALQRTSPSGVKSRLSRGREALRRHYRRLGLAVAADGGRAAQQELP
jgi:RNA polymerase sigma-70 factor (ECF subfamily)